MWWFLGSSDFFGLLLLLQVFQLKVNGVAFRLIPESTQVKNALKVMFICNQILENMLPSAEHDCHRSSLRSPLC